MSAIHTAAVHFEEDQRQMIILGLSRLAVERPGWSAAIEPIVGKLNAAELFRTMKSHYVPARLFAAPMSERADIL
jgi:hypothetical protein